MAILSNAHNLAITSGQIQFMDNSTTNNINGRTGIDVLREASCPDAAHDSSARSYRPQCFPGTREQYIQDIVDWVIPSLGDPPPPIYWMKGPAGVGKSAIAQTCSEKLKPMERLGAAFFFSISRRDLSLTSRHNDPRKFFPSIAYQLSTIHPPYRDLIDEKIRHDNTLVDKDMEFQFRYLISEPLQELASQGKGIRQRMAIIIDGLDECEGPGAQSEIVRIVAAAASDGTLPLCWAFFSRPEPHIEATFADPSIAPHCHKVFLPISRDADGEVEMYLRNSFENILKRRNVSVVSQWPSAEDMATLVGAAHGLFIYATTVTRFVDHTSLPGPQKRLQTIIDTILERHKHNRDDPDTGIGTDGLFAELDAFYRLILQRIPTENLPSVHLLLALICQQGRLGVILAANVLGMSKEDFEIVCNHASAIVHVQDPGKDLELDPTVDTNCTSAQVDLDVLHKLYQHVSRELGGEVTFYHKSFDDFLLDPARSGTYCAKGSEALAKHFLKMHLDYDRSYCWEGSELALAPGVTDSASFLSYPYTNKSVNSRIKASTYSIFGFEDIETFPKSGVFGASGANRDFRKHLYVATLLAGIGGSLLFSGRMWGCEFLFRGYPGTWVGCAPLAKFNVNEFKLMVKQGKQANILQRHHPKWPSQIKSLFRDKSRERFESAVYRLGQGEKSTFWYWEIDYDLGYYRHFQTIDLAEGKKIFRAEDFDTWFEEDEYESESSTSPSPSPSEAQQEEGG